MIIINAQITFEDFNCFQNHNLSNNIFEFPYKKPEKVYDSNNFTSQGKLKAKAADSVKTLEEIEKIKAYFLNRKEYRNYCLFIVGISTGYRCGDLLKLKFCNFLNEDNSWKNEIDIIEQKTKKRRTILITDSIKEALGLYIKNVGYHNLEEYVFKSQKGKNKPIGISPMRSIFNNMALDLKLPYHCSTHFLRKTFAYWFLQVHKDDMSALATLQDMLNHSSEKMTLKYCGTTKEKQNTMIKNVSELW